MLFTTRTISGLVSDDRRGPESSAVDPCHLWKAVAVAVAVHNKNDPGVGGDGRREAIGSASVSSVDAVAVAVYNKKRLLLSR